MYPDVLLVRPVGGCIGGVCVELETAIGTYAYLVVQRTMYPNSQLVLIYAHDTVTVVSGL